MIRCYNKIKNWSTLHAHPRRPRYSTIPGPSVTNIYVFHTFNICMYNTAMYLQYIHMYCIYVYRYECMLIYTIPTGETRI